MREYRIFILSIKQLKFFIACSLFSLSGGCAQYSLAETSPLILKAEVLPTAVDARLLFWEARLQRDPEDSTAAEQLASAYLNKAKNTGDFSYYIKTDLLLTPISKREPENYLLLTLLASAKAAQHKFQEALQMSEKAVVLMPEKATAFALLFDARMELGDINAAEQELLRLADKDPKFPDLLYRQSRILELKGENKKALEHLKSAVDSINQETADPDTKSWYHLQLGESYLKIGNLKEAESQYRVARELAPQSAFPLEHLAEVAAIEKNYAIALQLLTDATLLRPRPELLQAQGDIAALQGNNHLASELFQKAKEAFEKADMLCSGCFDHHLAALYSDSLPDSEKAVFYARKDYETRKTVGSFDALAWALFRAGKYDEAKVMIDKALQWGTKDGHLFYHASMIYGANGDLEKSREFLKSAHDVTPFVNSFHLHR